MKFFNGNRTERSTIQGVIGRVISNQPNLLCEADLKLGARLPTINPELYDLKSYYQLIVSITKCEKLSKSKLEKMLSKSKENISQ